VIGKLPSMQFYPGDWLKDPAVRACSLAARGLWFEILCLMWESPERGVLKTGDAPWGATEMASAVGADVTLVTKLLAELKSKGVASARAEDGALYSRRMVRDEVERRKETDRQRRWRYRSGSAQSVENAEAGAAADYAAPASAAEHVGSVSQECGGDSAFVTADGENNTRDVTGDVTPMSHDSSSSVSSSTSNLSLRFTGAVTGKDRSNQGKSRAGRQNNFEDQPRGRASSADTNHNTRLEELRLQAEILGRQERLRGKGWGGDSAVNASARVGTGPQPGACGVRAKASAIERARAREEQAS
jgi:hypothetical protein